MLKDLSIIKDFGQLEDLQASFQEMIRTYQIFSIELAGSYARSEQVNSDFYESDIEFLIFYSGKRPTIARIKNVDVNFINTRSINYLDKTFFLFDFTQTSKLMYGTTSAISPFGLDEIREWSVDEIILWRLYSVLKARMRDPESYRFSLLRNFDYLVTYHLLKKGIYFNMMSQRRENMDLIQDVSGISKNDFMRVMGSNDSDIVEIENCFKALLPVPSSLFCKRTVKDILRNSYRSLRAIKNGRLLTRGKVVNELYSAYLYRSEERVSIEYVEEYFKV